MRDRVAVATEEELQQVLAAKPLAVVVDLDCYRAQMLKSLAHVIEIRDQKATPHSMLASAPRAAAGKEGEGMKNMQGTIRVRAVTVDEQPALLVELPNGDSFALGREEMLAFCFTSLRMLRGMFATPDELNAAVLAAQQRIAPTPEGPVQ